MYASQFSLHRVAKNKKPRVEHGPINNPGAVPALSEHLSPCRYLRRSANVHADPDAEVRQNIEIPRLGIGFVLTNRSLLKAHFRFLFCEARC
jgi:hypothetical protein